MFGFVIGTLSLVGLIKVLKGGCGYGGGWSRCGGYGGGHGHHGHWGHHGWGHPHHGGNGGGGYGPGRWVLRAVSARLDATPAQEKVIAEAIENVMTAGRKVRETMFNARADVARSIKGEHFDEETLKDLQAKQDAALEELRKTAKAALQQVHEALDPKQREILAELIENGPAAFRGGWGGRGHHGGCGGPRWGHGEWDHTDVQSV